MPNVLRTSRARRRSLRIVVLLPRLALSHLGERVPGPLVRGESKARFTELMDRHSKVAERFGASFDLVVQELYQRRAPGSCRARKRISL
jgi:hypothetical protein